MGKCGYRSLHNALWGLRVTPSSTRVNEAETSGGVEGAAQMNLDRKARNRFFNLVSVELLALASRVYSDL